MNTLVLKAKRLELINHAESILTRANDARRDLTESERAEFNSVVAEAETISADITRLEQGDGVRSSAGGSPDPRIVPPLEPQLGISTTPLTRPGEGGGFNSVSTIPTLRLQAFANTREGHASAFAMGKWLQAHMLGDLRAMTWCQSHGYPIQNALSAGENAKGGVTVPEQWSADMIRLVETYGIFRGNSRVVPMTTDTLTIPRRKSGLTAYYTGEGTAGTESDMEFDAVQLSVKKLMILTRLSSELNDDSLVVMADMLAQEMAYGFALKEDTVGFLGDATSGSGGITGILVKAVDGSHGMAKVAAASGHDTLGEIDADDLIKLMSVIPVYAKQAGCAWYCSPTAEELIFNAAKVAGGGNTGSILAARQTPGFLGYPINVTPVMADDSTATYNDEVVVAFGNLSLASTLGSRRDVRIALSDQAYWEEDQIGVKGTMRHDIVCHDLGSDTAKSPFAVLVGTT